MNYNYEQWRNGYQSGDVVLCQGKGLISFLIRLITMGWSSHTGRLVWQYGRLYITHSTSLGKDSTGKKLDGVTSELFGAFVARYKGKIKVRSWQGLGISEGRRRVVVRGKMMEYRDRKYERKILELLGAAMPWKNKETEASKLSLFCSEYGCDIDKQLGAFAYPEEVISNELTPADYEMGRKVEKLLANGVALGPEIRIK